MEEKKMRNQSFFYKAGLALLLSLALVGCGNQQQEIAYQQINAEEAATMMKEEKDFVIVDVRTEEEYNEAHIADAICIPNESIEEEAINRLPDKEQLIFVYCRSGNRSKQAAEKLAEQGYKNIVEFGGIKDWNGSIESE